MEVAKLVGLRWNHDLDGSSSIRHRWHGDWRLDFLLELTGPVPCWSLDTVCVLSIRWFVFDRPFLRSPVAAIVASFFEPV
jgi:hypothetical protein